MASWTVIVAPLGLGDAPGVNLHATLGFIGPIGYQEMMVLAVVGVLIFGRRLPEVGRQLGKTLTGLRGTLQDFKDQINADEDLREAKSAITDIRQTLQSPAQALQNSLQDSLQAPGQAAQSFTDPKRLFDQLTHEEFAAPGPEATRAEPAGPSVFEQEAERLAQQAATDPSDPAANPPAGD